MSILICCFVQVCARGSVVVVVVVLGIAKCCQETLDAINSV